MEKIESELCDKVQAQVLYGPKDLRLVCSLPNPTEPHAYEYFQVSQPISPPLAEEVQIAMKATTLCGSDLHYYTHFRNGDIEIKQPLSQGHECAGLVVAVGSEVEAKYGLHVGDRVAVEAGVPCDECEVCLEGAYNVCEKMRFRSSATAFPHYQGTLRERFNHPAKWVHKLPDSLTYVDGALLEPLAVAIHAVRKAAAKPMATCLVIGAGAVGLLCAATAKGSGYGRVVMADIAQNRLAFALENGFADETVTLHARQPQSLGEGLAFAKEDAAGLVAKNHGDKFARVFECTGVEGCVRTAIHVSYKDIICSFFRGTDWKV
ncbi:putative D-xylulose reductase A [Lasiodiplodia hormozganensis]|uniref:D-xylulose reductase A n=1 Tax=Lasiodiplodia hormozganensis TaxID=869390 RepID=A0AA40CMT2_9PEZI|nr:putative D-xylulose reductase A [Lasiodiplodia hormozganensis]